MVAQEVILGLRKHLKNNEHITKSHFDNLVTDANVLGSDVKPKDDDDEFYKSILKQDKLISLSPRQIVKQKANKKKSVDKQKPFTRLVASREEDDERFGESKRRGPNLAYSSSLLLKNRKAKHKTSTF